MPNYQPGEVADADQFYAMVDGDLQGLIASYRSTMASCDRVEALDNIGAALACPHMDDGTEISAHQHAHTLASLMAVAIDRLARAEQGR